MVIEDHLRGEGIIGMISKTLRLNHLNLMEVSI